MKNRYKEIVEHYEQCLSKHGDNHLGVDWPKLEDVDKRYQIMLDIIRDGSDNLVSLLDFGCGTAHLYDYIVRSGLNKVQYSGLDISQKFVDVAKSKYPSLHFYCTDVLSATTTEFPTFDYVIMNGVFTEKRSLSEDDMWEYFSQMLQKVFAKTNQGLSFNVMSKNVDWEREDLFHVSLDRLTRFLCDKLSRNFVIRNDYGLYEYTVYIYKQPLWQK